MCEVIKIREEEPVVEVEKVLGDVYDFKTGKKQEKEKPVEKEIKYTKAGEAKKTPNNSKKGVSHIGYPFKDKEQVRAIQKYFTDRKNNMKLKPELRQIAGRNLMMFIIGINIGLRGSDLRKLTWGDVYNKDWSFQDGIRIQEKKTDKYKTFYFNKYATDAITAYVNEFKPLLNRELHVFRSRKGGAIKVDTICGIIKDAADAIGFKRNVGSHSLRRTFGYFWYSAHKENMDALIHLQKLFNHATPKVTLEYIGIEDEDCKEYYNDLEW